MDRSKDDFLDSNRLRVEDLMPGYVRTEVIQNSFEGSVNKFLTKEDSVFISGGLGDVQTPKIPEVTKFRSEHQLQPLIYSINGTDEQILSQEDILIWLREFGVDITKMGDWARTVESNLFLGINPEKVINFSDYYWVSEINDEPDYVVMKDRLKISKSRVNHMERLITELGEPEVTKISSDGKTISIGNDFGGLQNVKQIEIKVNGESIGIYNILRTTIDSIHYNFELITPITASESDAVTISLEPELNLVRNEDSLLRIGQMWNSGNNHWKILNKWVHKNDIEDIFSGNLIRAERPIIEFEDFLEMNEWVSVTHSWRHYNEISGEWEVTTRQPTKQEIWNDFDNRIINPTFATNWIYLGIEDTEDIGGVTENPNAIILRNVGMGSESANITLQSDLRTINIPHEYVDLTLANTMTTSVFVDGILQEGTYKEIAVDTVYDGISFQQISGFEFQAPLDISSIIEIYITPLGENDYYRYRVPITKENGEREIADISTNVKVGQVKYYNGQFPKFNIYELSGDFVRSGEIIDYVRDGNSIATDDIQHYPILANGLIKSDGTTYAFKDIRDNTIRSFWSGDIEVTAEEIVEGSPESVDSWGLLPHLLNATNSTKSTFEVNELVPHFISLIDSQTYDILGTSLTNNLNYDINYNEGGTIKFHDNCLSTIISIILTKTDLKGSILLANELYQQLLNQSRSYVLDYIVDYGTSSEATPFKHLHLEIYNMIIRNISSSDYYRKIFNDSNFSRRGFLWVDTLPSFGWVQKKKPMKIVDDRLGIRSIRHHDGQISDIGISEGVIAGLYDSILNYRVSPVRKRGWTINESPDNGPVVNNREDIPLNRLMPGDVWLDYSKNELYKLDLVYIGSDEPDKNYQLGSKWYNTTDGIIYELGNSGNIRFHEWRTTTLLIGDVWVSIDLEGIIIDTILEIENRLYDLSPDVDELTAKNLDRISKDSSYESQLQKLYNGYKRELGISESDNREYDPNNPFTWNYRNVLLGHSDVHFPYNKDATLWAARYEGIYKKIYLSETPHLTPWEMQGFDDMPIWWESEYRSNDGTWRDVMWDNIKSGMIPIGDVTEAPKYDFIPVITVRGVETYDGYGYGDLLPPFWIYSGDGIPNAADINASESVLIRNELLIREMNLLLDDPNIYEFGEFGPIENDWRNSSRFLYDRIIALLTISPIKLVNLLWGANVRSVNGMTSDVFNSKVVTNQLPLHGQEGLKGVSYLSGLGQWVVNNNRFKDINSGEFFNAWYNWEEKFGHLFDCFVDPKSLELVNAGNIISKNDYKLHIKTTDNKAVVEVSGLRVRVKKFGAHSLRNNRRIPRGYGHDWIFEIDSPQIDNFGLIIPKISTVEEVNLEDSSLLIGEHKFVTGDEVDISTNDTLPTPLRTDRPFYVVVKSDTEIRLATTRSLAMDGEYVQFTGYEGIGFIEISQNERKFFAMGGSHTAIEWKISTLSKDIEYFTFPLEVKGIQGLIDAVHGISEYSRRVVGIVPNPDGESLDPEYGRMTSWFGEIDKMVDAIFRGEGDGKVDENVSDILAYEVKFDPISDTMEILKKGIELQRGSEVFIYTAAVVPDGLVKGQGYYVIPTSNPSVYRLATSRERAASENYIDFQTNGSGRQYITISRVSPNQFDEWIYVNPYYDNFWIPTNTGDIGEINFHADIIMLGEGEDTGYVDEGDLFLYRYDKGTKLITRNKSKKFLSGKFRIRTSEHAIIFNRRSIDGPILYDSMTGQGLRGIDNISYKQIDAGVGRATFGGYVISGNVVTPNFEKLVDDFRRAYEQFGDETNFSNFKEELLGFPDEFMSGMGLSKGTRFQFWKAMIHRKGTKESVEALHSVGDLDEIELDDIWAYRRSVYGSSEGDRFMEFTIEPEHLNGSDLWISSRNVSTRVNSLNTEISDDPIVPPIIDCEYFLNAEDFDEYSPMVNELGIGDSKLLEEVNELENRFKFTLQEEDITFIRSTNSLVNQFSDPNLSFRGDANISRPNMVGFQLDVTNPFREGLFTTAGERINIRTYMVGKDSNGRGNFVRVDVFVNTNSTVDVESYYQTIGGNWIPAYKHEQVISSEYFNIFHLGYYIRKNTKSVGLILNGIDLPIFGLNDFPNTGEYFFDNLGVIIGTEFTTVGTTTAAIKDLTGDVKFISNIEDFQEGFPIGAISNICTSMLVGISCIYPTSDVSDENLLKSSEILFSGETIKNLEDISNTETFSDKMITIENTNLELIKYIHMTDFIENRLSNVVTSTSISGDLQLTQPDNYSFGIRIDNFINGNNLTQLGSLARVGMIYRGVDISLTEQWETEIRITGGQTVLSTGYSNTIEVEGYVKMIYPMEDSGGGAGETITEIRRTISLDSVADITQLEFGLYIDTVRSTIGIVANAEDYGPITDVEGRIVYFIGNHNSMLLNGYVIPYGDIVTSPSEDRIGDNIRFTMLTRLDSIGDSYGETVAICDNPILEDDGIRDKDIDFNWGTVNGPNDSVIRIRDRRGNYMSTIYGEN